MDGRSSAAAVIVLTGWREAGKTTLLQKLTAAACQAGWTVSGILSPARMDAGQRTGIHALDLRSGERRLLASRIPGELDGAVLGPWTFDPATFAWGDALLRQTKPCDLFVLDELGPLEFERRQGWAAAFDVLAQPALYRMAIVVVRPECLDAFTCWLSETRRFSGGGIPNAVSETAAEIVSLQSPVEIEQLAQALALRYIEAR